MPGATAVTFAAAFTTPLLYNTGLGPMLNSAGKDAPPPVAVLNATTLARPAFATSAASICALKCCESVTVVVRFVPFRSTVVPAAEFAPVTVNVNAPLPAFTAFGDSDEITGPCDDPPLSGTAIVHMLRPCVPASSTLDCRFKASDSTTTLG